MSALPTVIVIGAMKCGTSALHRYLDRHPEIAMSEPKELNFFFGPPDPGDPDDDAAWQQGNWGRGPAWYAAQFPADVPVRGESSPGYTSPSRPEVAARMRRVVPDAHLLYLVRDPVERAWSQYRHHRREGTEPRPPEEALLDPRSQYLDRGRYAARLTPFLDCFPREQVTVVAAEELLAHRRPTLRRLYGLLGVDDAFWHADLEQRWHLGEAEAEPLDPHLRDRLAEALHPDAERLRALCGLPLDAWSV